jgi:hypothetical protein
MKLDDIMVTIADTLRAEKVSAEIIVKVQKELEAVAKEEKEDRANAPKDKKKNKMVVVAMDPNGVLKSTGGLTGYVLQVNEEMPDAEVFTHINAAAVEFNRSKKGSKKPVRTVSDTIECVGRKFWKSDKPGEKVLVKTKSAIYLLATDGRLN